MILIIQTGDPVSAAVQRYGRFSEWFMTALNAASNEVMVVDVHLGEELPITDECIENISGVIITGSPAMVTEQAPWLIKTQKWLTLSWRYKIPTLGVCFGHQLLADMLGGKVTYNQQGRNLGLSAFKLNVEAGSDPLFKGIYSDNSINTFVSHLQHVKTLPASATLLGSCAKDHNHAFRAEGHIWGVQFHPEWNVAITQTYIEARSVELILEGFDPDKMISQLSPCHQAYSLLKHFSRITRC